MFRFTRHKPTTGFDFFVWPDAICGRDIKEGQFGRGQPSLLLMGGCRHAWLCHGNFWLASGLNEDGMETGVCCTKRDRRLFDHLEVRVGKWVSCSKDAQHTAVYKTLEGSKREIV